MPAWFVTGTGTDVGKTFVTQGLVRHLRGDGRAVQAIKPVVSGFTSAQASESDPGMLLAAMGRSITDEEIERIAPWRFEAPLSPHMAAAREGRDVPFDRIVSHSRESIRQSADSSLFIEGVGGLMVPLDGRHTVLDWMEALRLPVILVAGSYLGTLSHTLTAVEVLRLHGLTVAALVVSESAGSPVPLADTLDTLARLINPINVVALPRLADRATRHPAFGDLAAALL